VGEMFNTFTESIGSHWSEIEKGKVEMNADSREAFKNLLKFDEGRLQETLDPKSYMKWWIFKHGVLGKLLPREIEAQWNMANDNSINESKLNFGKMSERVYISEELKKKGIYTGELTDRTLNKAAYALKMGNRIWKDQRSAEEYMMKVVFMNSAKIGEHVVPEGEYLNSIPAVVGKEKSALPVGDVLEHSIKFKNDVWEKIGVSHSTPFGDIKLNDVRWDEDSGLRIWFSGAIGYRTFSKKKLEEYASEVLAQKRIKAKHVERDNARLKNFLSNLPGYPAAQGH
jgi:hypothetical protein